MKSQKIADSFKNAVGTVFLLAGAFFVCSTLVSMRSVLADPIAPIYENNSVAASANGRTNGAAARSSARTSPRYTQNTSSRATVARTTAPVSNARSVAPARAVTSRANVARANAGRGNAASRNVVSRQTAVTSRANAAATRSVRARTATTDAANNALISLTGSAIRGSKANTSSSYSYLTNKLYTGNYSNIIDTSTGLISSEAFSNCMESYYTCMDEICTARNAAQRRCACAGRVKAFAEAETALETANEELIKVSGELALLIANKGKDVSEAFQLTDAEKVMNCVSWKEMSAKFTVEKDSNGNGKEDDVEWCQSHGYYDTSECSSTKMPKYCSTANNGNNFGFNIDDLDGAGSDILAQLRAWADAKEQTITILDSDEDGLLGAFKNLSGVVSGLAGFGGVWDDEKDVTDSLAETWGYELFQYAHNNVCARVLDSCFNGIYEACGTPPSGTKCSNGAAQCPYNYNSKITVNNSGTYEPNFVNASSGYTTSNTATCFGYTTATGDPYSNLRGPVADARRSIMQKYALDANADCDAYGEQLRATAQNIGYQKIAAQQALQQKRLEFANEERETILNAAINAGTHFDDCVSELYECYEAQLNSHGPGKGSVWTVSRIRTYCSQIANVPSCYEEMICHPSTAQFRAVIDKADSAECLNTQDYTTNTCRTIVTLNELLNGTGASTEAVAKIKTKITEGKLYDSIEKVNSAALREYCLQDAIGMSQKSDDIALRTWLKETWDEMDEAVKAENAKESQN